MAFNIPFLNKSGKARPASFTDTDLKQRKVKFHWEDTPLDWIPNQPYASHFINEINMILPAGEFWFFAAPAVTPTPFSASGLIHASTTVPPHDE